MTWGEVQRLMAQYPERWTAVGCDVFAEHEGVVEIKSPPRALARHYLGNMQSPSLARLVVMIHNSYLPLARELVMLRRRVKDIERCKDR